jgi:hypothetical protein
MKKWVLIVIQCLFAFYLFGQTIPAEYYLLAKKADSLLKQKEYQAAAFKYSEAFKTLGGKGVLENRYNAARAWAMAGFSDSAFYNLNRIVSNTAFVDHKKISKEDDFKSLHKNEKWPALITKIKNNADSIEAHKAVAEAMLNKPLIKKLDSMVVEDQKWRNLTTKISNGEKLDKSIDKNQIMKNWIMTDSMNTAEVRKIFYQYGFPNYDLVGPKGANDFWLLIQHQDRHPSFQDSVLTKMKIEVDKGKAPSSSYAYLLDRVKVNTKQLQVYGTQMTLNKEGTSFEPQPVIEPEKLNERRKSVGLHSIEEYIETMNSHYHGSLKKNKSSK